MKVYVLNSGFSEDWVIRGVFTSKEKAKAAWNPPLTKRDEDRSYVWQDDVFYAYGVDYAEIQEFELDAA